MRRALKTWPGVAAGLACGLVVAVLLGADGNGSPTPPGAQNRYQLHVWSTNPSSSGYAGAHGAYRIDGWTGQVFRIDEQGKASEITFPPPQGK